MGKGQVSVTLGEALEKELVKLAGVAKRSLSEMAKLVLEEALKDKKKKKK